MSPQMVYHTFTTLAKELKTYKEKLRNFRKVSGFGKRSKKNCKQLKVKAQELKGKLQESEYSAAQQPFLFENA